MKGKKKLLIVLLLVLAAAVTGVLTWLRLSYHVVGFTLYPRNVAELDLRGQEISISDYETLAQKMPDTQIRWDVPFQDGVIPCDAAQITLASLKETDLAVFAYLENLKTVNAWQCADFAQLVQLQEQYPQLQVKYYVPIGGEKYYQGTTRVEVDRITPEELELLAFLPELETVVVKSAGDMESLARLQEYCRENRVDFCIQIGGSLISHQEQDVVISGITDAELELLVFLRDMITLHLQNIQAAPEAVCALQEAYPDVQITWEQEIAGMTFRNTDTEVDLSTVVIEDLEAVENALAYLPEVQTVIFGLCGIDNPAWGNSKAKNLAVCDLENEEMAAYRDRVREDYKVVWTVRLGPSMALRTDADNFMPGHFGVGQLFDDYAYNLRYCEDMVCLDVGHMTLTDISFVEFMPKLKYLILAWTEVQYIEPIRSCKNLVFLELDNSCIRDYSPLVDCTALEDLNLGNTFCDITPVLEMTWLKNLWMIFGSGISAWKASQALPDTHVVASGTATVASGWRNLQNYYDMRDCLGMYYMN